MTITYEGEETVNAEERSDLRPWTGSHPNVGKPVILRTGTDNTSHKPGVIMRQGGPLGTTVDLTVFSDWGPIVQHGAKLVDKEPSGSGHENTCWLVKL